MIKKKRCVSYQKHKKYPSNKFFFRKKSLIKSIRLLLQELRLLKRLSQFATSVVSLDILKTNAKQKKKKINALVIDESHKKTQYMILINELKGEDLKLKVFQRLDSTNDESKCKKK